MCSLSNWGTQMQPSLHQRRECAFCATAVCNHLYINVENAQSVQLSSATISTSTSRMCSLSNWVLQPSLHQHRECAVSPTGFCNHLYINVENAQSVQLGSATIFTSTSRMRNLCNWVLQPSLHQRRECAVSPNVEHKCNHHYINIENA